MGKKSTDYQTKLKKVPPEDLIETLVRDVKKELFAINAEATAIDVAFDRPAADSGQIIQTVREAALRILSRTERAQIMLDAARAHDHARHDSP